VTKKKLKASKPVAIVRAQPLPRLAVVSERITAALGALATALSADLAPVELGRVILVVKKIQDTSKALYENGRERMLQVVSTQGAVTTDNGTRALDVDGIHLEARPRSGGFDDRKIEAMLRAKGLSPEKWMLPTVTYSYDEGMMRQAVTAGSVTTDELEACRKPATFNLHIAERE